MINFKSCLHLNYPQKISSAKTSLKQISRCFSAKNGYPFPQGSVICDYGGGAYDLNIEEMARRGCILLVIDPFNRSKQYNESNLEWLSLNPPNYVTCNNVLNVIEEDDALMNCINNVACLAQRGTAIFTIHDGDRDGRSRETPRGYQRHQPLAYYTDILKKCGVFNKVFAKNGMIICE